MLPTDCLASGVTITLPAARGHLEKDVAVLLPSHLNTAIPAATPPASDVMEGPLPVAGCPGCCVLVLRGLYM